MDKKQKKLILRYIDLVIKKRWFIIIPVCLSLAAGIYLSITLPKTYQATTLILVESSKVPSSVVEPIVSEDIKQKINTISEQIMSRTYLDRIMNQYDLFSEPEHEKMFPEDKYQHMRENIEINTSRSGKGIDAFKLSYKGKDPEKVKNVANALAKFFIDQSLDVLLSGALGTLKFLEGELKEMQRKLEQQEGELSNFRKKYMGRLPDQLRSNLSSLDRLQMALEARQDALSEARNRLVQIENQTEETRRLRDLLAKQMEERSTDPDELNATLQSVEELPPEVVQLQKLRDQQSQMLSRYTEKHPDVIRLKARIEELENKLQSRPLERKESAESPGTDAPAQRMGEKRDLPEAIGQLMPERTELIAQYNDTKFEIKKYLEDIEKIREQIAEYEKRVEETPKIEAELQALTRDYNNINETYNSLLARKLEAEIAASMERQAKGTRFQILDYAKTPKKPISPDAKMLFLLFTAAGFGIGGGIIFLFGFLDGTVRDPDEIHEITGKNVEIIVIPKIYTPSQRLFRYANWSLSLISMSIALALFLGFALLTVKGFDQTMAMLKNHLNFLI